MTQQEQALKAANGIRLQRAALRREVRGLPFEQGRARVADVLECPPDFMESAVVFRVLQWPRYTGEHVARSMLVPSGASELRRVGELTDRQVAVLAGRLRDGAREQVAA